MSKDERSSIHPPADARDGADYTNTQDAAAPPAPSGGSSFFIQERERLIADIAESLGEIMTNTNALNRKIEESVLVGQEFEPVAQLWGKFAAMMGGEQQQQMMMQQQTDDAKHQQQHQQQHAASTSGPAPPVAQTPFQVAPGGGTWSTSGAEHGQH